MKKPIPAPKIGFFLGGGGFDPLSGEWTQRDSQKAHFCAETRHIDRQNRSTGDGSARSAEQRKKKSPTKPKHVTCHVFAETTHVVAAQHRFARVVTPADVVMYSRCQQNPIRGFGFWSKFAFSRYFGYFLLQQLVLPYKPQQAVIHFSSYMYFVS